MCPLLSLSDKGEFICHSMENRSRHSGRMDKAEQRAHRQLAVEKFKAHGGGIDSIALEILLCLVKWLFASISYGSSTSHSNLFFDNPAFMF